MTDEEIRIEVQRVLLAERRVSDVSFTPASPTLEVVHFWDNGLRSQFTLDKRAIKDKQQLALAVKAQAGSAFEASVKVAIASQAPTPAPVVETVKPDLSETVREEAFAER